MNYTEKQIELLNLIGITDLENIVWDDISINFTLSEEFIREFKDYVDWYFISSFQNLSEDFIREFKNYVTWLKISMYQQLSEKFIREFKDDVYWYEISLCQNLSENFISEHKEYVSWYNISNYQKLSPEFIQEFENKLTIDESNWLYKTTEFKKQAIVSTGLYECYDDHFIAYKAIRTDRYSNFNFQYQYLPNQYYTSHCDCSHNENSFGLSVWTEEGAKVYGKNNLLIVKVKVNYEDIGRLVHGSNKIRCSKIFILE